MQVVTSINCFYDAAFRAPVEEQITRLYDAGFRALDMNFWDWCHDPQSPFVAEGWQDWMGRIADTAARLNIKFVQAHAHVYNFYREPDPLLMTLTQEDKFCFAVEELAKRQGWGGGVI